MSSRVALLVLLSACTGEEKTDLVIADGTLTGTVDGVAWTFVRGEVDPYMSEDDLLFAVFWPEDYDTCELTGHDATSYLIVQIPGEVGEYDFTTDFNGTFVYDDGDDNPINVATLDGVVRVDELTGDVLSGGLAMTDGASNDVSGAFSLVMCDK